MLYTSTRDNTLRVSSAQAIAQGISADGGLFVPCEVPQVGLDFIGSLCDMSYRERAKAVLEKYLTDFSSEELESYVGAAYADGKFSSEKTAPVVHIGGSENVIELWRGPTCAFKDMALQLLPHLLTGAAKKTGNDKRIVILVATSGDTGKAALEGFKDVDGTSIAVFFPNSGVSPMQQKQMQTQDGSNVAVCAVNGNFDDAQTGVKKLFTDDAVKAELSEKGCVFSSANSINWGRLAPQIVYYFSAYAEMVSAGRIALGDRINFVVPTGNFGNILAANYAVRMGLPVNKLICASNANNVLTDFITTGTYDRNRHFYLTLSPSMDILISSNLERLIFTCLEGDSEKTRALYSELAATGRFTADDGVMTKIKSLYAAGCCDDAQTKEEIKRTFDENGYLCDPHTAVAVRVYKNYAAETGDDTPTVIASTASPFKFCTSVVEALGAETSGDDFENLSILEKLTGLKAPAQLSSLRTKPVRFSDVCDGDAQSMKAEIISALNL